MAKAPRRKKCEILVINQIAQVGLKRFPAERYAVVKDADDPQAILVRSQDLHAYEFGPSLRALGRAGAGVNNIPVDALSKRGVPVFNAPGADRKSTRLNSSHLVISYAVFCLKKKKKTRLLQSSHSSHVLITSTT